MFQPTNPDRNDRHDDDQSQQLWLPTTTTTLMPFNYIGDDDDQRLLLSSMKTKMTGHEMSFIENDDEDKDQLPSQVLTTLAKTNIPNSAESATKTKIVSNKRIQSLKKQSSAKISNQNPSTNDQTSITIDDTMSKNSSHQQSQQQNYNRLNFSISRWIRFFSFRKKLKKFKINHEQHQATTNNLRGQKSHSSLPFIKRKQNVNNSQQKKEKISKDDSDLKTSNSKDFTEGVDSSSTNDHLSVFTRFVRTFSFLYKRSPQSSSSSSNKNSKFKRSTSLHNPRKSKSLPEIKKHQHPQQQQIGRRHRTKSDSDNVSAASPIHRSEPLISTVQRSSSKSPSKKPLQKHQNMPNGDIVSNINIELQPQSIYELPVIPIKITGKKESSPTKIRTNHEPLFNQIDHSLNSNGTSKLILSKNTEISIVDFDNHHNNNHQHLSINQSYHQQQHRQHLVSSGLETPAVCGIQNHGNTCFINSIIQCLSNTVPFTEYFVLDYYRDDLAQNRLLSMKRSTIRGELTEHLALLLKSLWACMYSSDISLKFKKICSKYAQQYQGYEQHDAQEFLLWLLDKSHEELSISNPQHSNSKASHKNNFVSMFKGATTPNHHQNRKRLSNEKSDETAAVEFLARCQTIDTSSIVFDLFQGQLRSTIVCPNCRHCSKTFDPYMSISLPVPIRLKFTIFIQAIFKENRSTVMYGVSIEAAATLRELRDRISRMIKVPERRLILLQQPDPRHGLVEFSSDHEMIQQIFEDCEEIYALETPELPTEDNVKMCQQMLTIVWLNRVGTDRRGSIFGPLFSTLVSREISFRKLQATILSEMAEYVIEHENIDFVKLSNEITLRLHVLNGLNEKEYLQSDVDHPLFVRTVECALARTEDRRQYRGPYHLKLLVEWDMDLRQSILVTDAQFDVITNKNEAYIDKSVEFAKECSKMNNRTTLQDCLDMYFRDESLTEENAWWCTSCDSRQQCVKQLNIWSLPDILIIHLKRFRYISDLRRLKVNTMIEYPQNGLDLLKYVQRKCIDSNGDLMINNHHSLSSSSKKMASSSSSKLTYKRMGHDLLEETTYNLYAVCCHHGTMQGGHYTAYCKNSVDNCWYLFDDTKVMPILEEAVVTPDAYILFYQKSYVSSAYSSISLMETSKLSPNTNEQQQHWAFHMPPFNYYNNHNFNNKSSTLPNRRSVKTSGYSSTTNHHHSNSTIDSSNLISEQQYSDNHHYQQPKTPIFNGLSSTSKRYPQNFDYHHDYHDIGQNDCYYNQYPNYQDQMINTFPRNKSKYLY